MNIVLLISKEQKIDWAMTHAHRNKPLHRKKIKINFFLLPICLFPSASYLPSKAISLSVAVSFSRSSHETTRISIQTFFSISRGEFFRIPRGRVECTTHRCRITELRSPTDACRIGAVCSNATATVGFRSSFASAATNDLSPDVRSGAIRIDENSRRGRRSSSTRSTTTCITGRMGGRTSHQANDDGRKESIRITKPLAHGIAPRMVVLAYEERFALPH